MPYQGYTELFKPTSSRGPWSQELSKDVIHYLSDTPHLPTSTRDNIEAWIGERLYVERYHDIAKGQNEILEMLFTIVCRDTAEILAQMNLQLRDVERAMLLEASVQDNVLMRREMVNQSRGILEELGQRLPAFIEKYSSTEKGSVSVAQRWTSLDPTKQLLRRHSTVLYYKGPTSKTELAAVKNMVHSLKRSIQQTLKSVERTNLSLSSTLALLDNKRAISEAESVTKLTELAFIFIPLSFSASFFSMPIDVSPTSYMWLGMSPSP